MCNMLYEYGQLKKNTGMAVRQGSYVGNSEKQRIQLLQAQGPTYLCCTGAAGQASKPVRLQIACLLNE